MHGPWTQTDNCGDGRSGGWGKGWVEEAKEGGMEDICNSVNNK